MKIRETNLSINTRSVRRLDAVNRIVIHHTASGDVSAAEIDRWHRRRGWAAIGYHYVIRRNGDIERGRSESLLGVHAGHANVDSIGIALTGNFTVRVPARLQMTSLVWLISNIRWRHGLKVIITRHSDHMNTLCPGNLFPWEELLDRVNVDRLIVRHGDTLWSIAAEFLGGGQRWEEIAAMNGIRGSLIHPGQTLILPRE